mgnify:CR=1 FL=1
MACKKKNALRTIAPAATLRNARISTTTADTATSSPANVEIAFAVEAEAHDRLE